MLRKTYQLMCSFKTISYRVRRGYSIIFNQCPFSQGKPTQMVKFMGPTWGPPESCRPQMGPMLPHEPCYQGRLPKKGIFKAKWLVAALKMTNPCERGCKGFAIMSIRP